MNIPQNKNEVKKLMRIVQDRLILGGYPVTQHVPKMLDALNAAGLSLIPTVATEEMGMAFLDAWSQQQPPEISLMKGFNHAIHVGDVLKPED